MNHPGEFQESLSSVVAGSDPDGPPPSRIGQSTSGGAGTQPGKSPVLAGDDATALHPRCGLR